LDRMDNTDSGRPDGRRRAGTTR